MKRKLLSLILVLVSLMNSTAIVHGEASPENPFSDVESSDWYYEYVLDAYSAGIMEGKEDGIFDPNTNITRAELITVLCRMSDLEYEGCREHLTFPDADKSAWYADYVGWAEKNGVVKGYPDGTLRPDAPVTRQEMAELMGEFITFKAMRTTKDPQIDIFSDQFEIPDWALANVEKLRDFGLISGDEQGRFNPTANATRAELAKITSKLDPLVYPNDRYKRSRFEEIFAYGEEDAPLPYRIYVPENYDESKEYPLLVFLHGNSAQGDDNEKHLPCVKNAFLSPYSPVYDSIVVVPQCPEGLWWHDSDGTIDLLCDLMDYINERYSTDSTRQYVSGISMGGDGSWQMAIHRPEKVSAIMPVAGTGFTFYSDETGTHLFENNPESLKVNIHYIYDRDDVYSDRKYNQMVYEYLMEAGAVNLTYHETVGYGHGVCGEYAGYYNLSHLEWLYSQRRETVGPASTANAS